MEDALRRLPGRRDWSGFADSRCEKEDRVRTLSEAAYAETGGEGRFLFRADGFLTRMVRNLVGTLLEVGRGRMPPERIDQVLATGDRTLAGPTAPARGLHLFRVAYPGEDGPGPAARVGGREEEAWNGSW
jgi:tRNA pseudouridine38-40 synthase